MKNLFGGGGDKSNKTQKPAPQPKPTNLDPNLEKKLKIEQACVVIDTKIN